MNGIGNLSRSVVIATGRAGDHHLVVPPRGLYHQHALWLASDMEANDGWRTQVVRLPRRLFRGRHGRRREHAAWVLTHGRSLAWVL